MLQSLNKLHKFYSQAWKLYRNPHFWPHRAQQAVILTISLIMKQVCLLETYWSSISKLQHKTNKDMEQLD